MDIGSILSHAGGAGAIARELGVDESTVESGAGALLPEVMAGIQTQGLPPVIDSQVDANGAMGAPMADSTGEAALRAADLGAFSAA